MTEEAIDILEYYERRTDECFADESVASCLADGYKLSPSDSHAVSNEASAKWLTRKSKTSQYVRILLAIFVTGTAEA